jgi:hypothetical protein
VPEVGPEPHSTPCQHRELKNIPNPAQSDRYTTESRAKRVDIVHTFFCHLGAPPNAGKRMATASRDGSQSSQHCSGRSRIGSLQGVGIFGNVVII